MTKNIIFDLGGVLLDFHPSEYMKVMGFDLEKGKKYQDIIWGSKEWYFMDIGQMTYEEATSSICKDNPLYAKDLKYLLENRSNKYILKQNEEMYQYVKKLKVLGFKIYFLSNVIADDLEYNSKNFEIFNLIDGATYSCLCGYAKPDDEIYQKLLTTYSLNPVECVFIDDAECNCIAALNNDIPSIVFKNPAQIKTELNSLLNIDDNMSFKFKKTNYDNHD